MGRPSVFTPELSQKICARLAEGESLRSICRGYDMPAISTVMYWLLDEDKKDFLEQYKVARDIQADLMVEEMLEIADDGTNDYIEKYRQDGEIFTVVNAEHIQRSRLRVDTRKWTASKLKPKKYGDKLDLTSLNEKLPTPLLAYALLDNDSDPKGTEAA